MSHARTHAALDARPRWAAPACAWLLPGSSSRCQLRASVPAHLCDAQAISHWSNRPQCAVASATCLSSCRRGLQSAGACTVLLLLHWDSAAARLCRRSPAHAYPCLSRCIRALASRSQSSARLHLRHRSALRSWASLASLSSSSSSRSTTSSLAAARHARLPHMHTRRRGPPLLSTSRACLERATRRQFVTIWLYHTDRATHCTHVCVTCTAVCVLPPCSTVEWQLATNSMAIGPY